MSPAKQNLDPEKIDLIFLSVVVPVFNEAERVEKVGEIARYLKTRPYATELVVVDDGSTDDTHQMLQGLQKQHALTIVTYHHNQGKGAAIRAGMLTASGRWRLFMDVDLSVPLSTIAELEKHLKKNTADVIIGTRKVDQAQVIVAQHPLREKMGVVFTRLSRWWLQVNTSDFTCGFKVFSNTAAERIFSLALLNRWGFDAEIIFLAHRLQLKIKELPVLWKNDSRTKVRFPQDAIGSLWELWQVRLHQWQGHYALAKTPERLDTDRA